MSSHYYKGPRAHLYNRRWRSYTQRTLEACRRLIDSEAIESSARQQNRPPCLLDVACGTGILLATLREQFPAAALYGIDASEDMLAQARLTLRNVQNVQLSYQVVSAGERAGLTFAPGSFDLITCCNVLHDLRDPVGVITGLGHLLAPGGQIIIEDFSSRQPPFPWWLIEWLARLIERNHVHAYTLDEARGYCQQAGLAVRRGRAFIVNWLWHGWVIDARAC